MPRYPTDPQRTAKTVFQEIEEFGEIKSPMTKKLFTRGNTLSPKQMEMRDELVFLLWEMLGKDENTVRIKTGMNSMTLHRIIKKRTAGKELIAKTVYENEVKLEEARYTGRKALIDRCFEGAARALERGIELINEMKPLEAIKAAAILTDKGLLLSGQPTSRVAKTDERMMSDEELESKAREYASRLGKIGLVDGAKQSA